MQFAIALSFFPFLSQTQLAHFLPQNPIAPKADTCDPGLLRALCCSVDSQRGGLGATYIRAKQVNSAPYFRLEMLENDTRGAAHTDIAHIWE